MNDNLTLRQQFALVALQSLASKTFDSDIQQLARTNNVEESEVIATYCWQIADDMIRMMDEE